MQCCGDCEDPQPCADCGTGCCWWETAGVVNVSSGVWSGSFHQVNFIWDDIAVRKFVCVDLAQSDIEQLWSQLPEVVEEELVTGKVPAAVPVLPHSLSLLCMNASSAAPVLNQVQGILMTESSEQELVVYTDGSVKGLVSAECCGGAGVVVLDGDRSMGEVSVRLGGWMSSTKAEVNTCITALAALPVS